jgi:phage shock protein PspC (stress-responsive transcriptional regulator)
MTAILMTLGVARGLRMTFGWRDVRVATVAAVVSAIAAVAVATIIISAFALFPVLDSSL